MDSEARNLRRELRERVHGAGWGFLVLWTGAALLLPGRPAVLWHVWLIGVGVILLCASLVALRFGLRPTWATVILGVVALASGVCGLAGVPLSAVGLVLILAGLVSTVSAIRDRTPARGV